ncbi:MAG: hypothetical protein JXQ81_01660 [Desulfuromonadales bacterium]|nr:hypothetical protein [Desulfuromonadales bacterium]MBN2791192.1 hypothetical protein [Desulfuromonadales bacterium]
MILHPGILALLSLSAVIFIIMLVAGWHSLKLIVYWDANSSSERQLLLERKTWLISTLLNYTLTVQIFSLLLFVFTADDIHRLFIGAMCATGSLNANLVGWLVLLVKGVLLFMASFWVVFNQLDQRTEDAPLTRLKYIGLLLMTPLFALDLYLQWRYFSGLQPEVITSCCGSLFSAEGEGVAGDLAGMPIGQAMTLFFSVAGFYLLVLLACLRTRRVIFRPLLFVASVLMFFISLGAVVAFISLYIYQMPSHHCPFDMLQANYGYIGYPMYIGLYCAALFGMLPGLAQPLRKYIGLRREIDLVERQWLLKALGGMVVFLLIACWQMIFGSFKLLGY